MENEKEREDLVKREVLCDVSDLVQELLSQKKYLKDLSELIGQEDEDGNMPQVYEHWVITPWLGEKLKERGELVVMDFYNLTIWGRQSAGQLTYVDDVIGDIVNSKGKN